MSPPTRSKATLAAALLCIQTASVLAEEDSPFGTRIVQGFNQTALPFTQNDSEFDLEFRPKLGDIIHEPYIRMPFELGYGFTPKLEGRIGMIPFLANPFHSDPIESDGYFTFGAKQRIDALKNERLAVAVGFDGRVPLEPIPSDWLRNNYTSYTPFIVGAYEIDSGGEWTVFTNLSYELLDKDRNQAPDWVEPPSSLTYITSGFIHHPPGDFRYGLRFLYVTEDFDGGRSDGLKVIPSATWYPPDDAWFFRSIAGHFELTLDLEWAVTKLPELSDESTLGLNLEVRWSFLRKNERAKEDVVP